MTGKIDEALVPILSDLAAREDGQAANVLTKSAPMIEVESREEDNNASGEEDDEKDAGDGDAQDFAPESLSGLAGDKGRGADIGHDDESSNDTNDEASEMSKVVNVREEAQAEGNYGSHDQNNQIANAVRVDRPVDDEVHKIDAY